MAHPRPSEAALNDGLAFSFADLAIALAAFGQKTDGFMDLPPT